MTLNDLLKQIFRQRNIVLGVFGNKIGNSPNKRYTNILTIIVK